MDSPQEDPAIVSDGSGGVIVVWMDTRSGAGASHLYAQRFTSTGAIQTGWPTGGLQLSALPENATEHPPALISDGQGGAIVTWNSAADGCDGVHEPTQSPPCTGKDVYAQRVTAAGAIDTNWPAEGLLVCNAVGNQDWPRIASDGAHGAFITWDTAVQDPGRIGVQHVLDSGELGEGWPADGVTLVASQGSHPSIVSDDSMGAIITWQDIRNGSTNVDIYAQRVTSDGDLLWTAGGVSVCAASAHQVYPSIVSDGSGGAIVAWQDARTSAQGDNIYAQRVTAGGQTSWTTNGVALCTAAGIQEYAQLVEDGTGGAIVTWQDARNSGSTQTDIYAQRINLYGEAAWASNGVTLCDASDDQKYPTIVSDGAYGAIVTWQDYRSGANGTKWDIYAQWLTAGGATWWGDEDRYGAPLSDAIGDQVATAHVEIYPTIAADGSGGAMVTWQDGRAATANIYARRAFVPAPTIDVVYWGDTFIQAAWSRDPDVIDLGTMNWELYVDGVLEASGPAQGETEGLAEAEGFSACTSYDVVVRIVSQDGLRSGPSNTVSGETCCIEPCEVLFQGGGGDSRAQRLTPGHRLSLGAPRPNPAREGTLVRWSIPPDQAGERFQLAVFDVGGRKVATVAEGNAEAGQFSRRFRPRAVSLESGVYFLRLQIGATQLTRSLILTE